jgi:Zn-dependent protease
MRFLRRHVPTAALAPADSAPPKPPNPWVGPAILLVWLALGALLTRAPGGVAVFAFVMVGWILGVMVHEFCHAAVAWLGGDHTVKAKGYLAFDPRRYGDLGTSLVMPVIFLLMGGIGFPGGAVYLRNDLMRGPLWRAAAAAAGPAATAAILLALVGGLRVWANAGGGGALFDALAVLAFLQAMGLILNSLPVPGLDGFGVIRPFLPAGLNPHLRKAEGLAMLGLFLAIMLVPRASLVLFQVAAGLCGALGLPLDPIGAGWAAFHFWKN